MTKAELEAAEKRCARAAVFDLHSRTDLLAALSMLKRAMDTIGGLRYFAEGEVDQHIDEADILIREYEGGEAKDA
jgi:hypothetical protein